MSSIRAITLSDVQSITATSSFALEGEEVSPPISSDYEDVVAISESISAEAITEQLIELEATVTLGDIYTSEILDVVNCIPWSGWGGDGWYPAILLARELGGVWEIYKSYTFTKYDEVTDDWKYNEFRTQEPKIMSSNQVRLFPVSYQPAFILGARQDYCSQELTTFLMDYAAHWLESCPTNGSEKRKILYFALGILQENRYGTPVGALEVYFETSPLSVIERIDGNRGRYRHTLNILSRNLYSPEIIDSITAGDYSFNYEWTDEVNRHISGIVPWGSAV